MSGLDAKCPSCGSPMRRVELSEWQLFDRAAATYICERCTRTERIAYRVEWPPKR